MRIGGRMIPVVAVALLAASCAGPTTAPTPTRPSDRPGPPAGPSSTPTQPTVSPTATPRTSGSALAPGWHATERMPTPHAYHTTTLLRNGNVLVTGGLINDRLDGYVSVAAEAFDPTLAAWTVTDPMTVARWGHTATLLADGTVLVAGGYINSADSMASTERYDPDLGSWVATGDMREGRGGHTATTLDDGTVLVAGGYTLSSPSGLASAERYDPGPGSWTATPRMGTARQGHTATALADGTVLVVGGGGEVRLAEGPAYGATAESYDPRTDRWTAVASLHLARFGHSATLLPDGRVLVVGGSAGDETTARSAELYDPRTGRWTMTSSMGVARSGHTATTLPDGTVLVAGGSGMGSDPIPLLSAERYDPTTQTWTAIADMTSHRGAHHTATLLPDGRVLVVGDYDDESRAEAELYTP